MHRCAAAPPVAHVCCRNLTTLVDGTNDLLLLPIPSELLSLPVATPGVIRVVANGVPAACAPTAPGAGTEACAFTGDSAKTPAVTSVAPSTTLDFGAAEQLELTIAGTGFSATKELNEVTVGGAACVVSAATATSLTCTIQAAGTPAGERPLRVRVINDGYADPTAVPTLTVKTLRIDTITPTTLSNGGLTMVNITGRGFDDDECEKNVVTIGGVSAGVLACAPNALTVLFPGQAATTTGAASVQIDVYEGETVVDTKTSADAVTIDGTTGPSVTGFTAPTPGTDVLPGSGGPVAIAFDSEATAADVDALFLIPALPTSFNDGAAAHTALAASFAGPLPCVNFTTDGASVTCAMGPVPNGRYTAAARLKTGRAFVASAGTPLQAGIYLTSVSPSAGSIGGNTLVTITGSGFDADGKDANVVVIPVPVSTTYLVSHGPV